MDTVGPEHVARNITTVPNKASKTGMHYVAANGTPIHNQGEHNMKGKVEHGMNVPVTTQVSDVCKVLASTAKVRDAGNMQVFTKTGGWIIGKR